ncbi:ATP-binding protein [Xiamenia xianingshaonis]|uniref:ATP-binding protein n=1 Tax=Xiamenia xianingshaonis TaxID=2682776 RepID=UPI0021BDCE49|nr:ATP-binding protein [Xiamenia xianingshaonis]
MNPFKPTAGKMPPILIGRQGVIDVFTEGLENGAGAPGRLMLIMGQRGYGKTVMLTELCRIALDAGWDVVSDTASAGLCDRLVESLDARPMKIQKATVGPSLSIAGVASLSVGQLDLSSAATSLDLRKSIERRLRKLPRGKGVLFTIDETQAASLDELESLATALQHVVRDQDLDDAPDSEKKGVAFAFAALPSIVDEVLNNKVLTFLRRSLHVRLDNVDVLDVREAYLETIASSGKSISLELAEKAACATAGYPYMIQLVGYYLWQSAHRRKAREISDADVEQGIKDATVAFGNAVCAPVFNGLAEPQQNFLEAFARLSADSADVGEIAKEAGKSMSWASKYRRTLIDAQVIEADGRGRVKFAIPRFGEYLQRE